MKSISSKNIIAKVFRDFGVHETNFVHNAVEWIGEALERIGTTVIYNKVVCEYQVCDHRVCLPANLERLDAVIHDCTRLKLGADQTTVGYTSKYADKTDTDKYRYYYPNDKVLPGNSQSLEHMYNPDENEVIYIRHSYYDYPYNDVDYYNINPGYIITSFESGSVLLYYQAFPVDADGFPMVWDNVYVREACAWSIMSRLLLSGYQHPAGLNFMFAKEEFERYILLARAADFPSIDATERFRNMWVRMVPDIDAYARSFQHSEVRGDIWR